MPELFWIGNQRAADYRPAPNSGMDSDREGITESLTYEDGGANVENSIGTHQVFNLSWSAEEYNTMKWLNEYRNGLHGNGLLYFVDPFVDNPVPTHWARPELCLDGWPSLIDNRVKPSEEITPANAFGMPSRGARFDFTPASVGARPWRGLVLLIPYDKTLHLGFTGTVDSNTALIAELTSTAGDVTREVIPMLSPTENVRMNLSYSGATYKSVRVFPTSIALGSSSFVLYSSQAQYSSAGVTPTLLGNHVEGEGHSGLRIDGVPTMQYIMAADGRRIVSAAVALREMGSWV